MELDGRDLERRARPAELIDFATDPLLRLSNGFPDVGRLLDACCARGLEGIVSKKLDQRYVSGRNRGWVKVKCHAWRAANRDRGEMFKKREKAR